MLLEVVAFWGFISLFLIGLAELHIDFRMLGVIGSMLLIPMAFWVWSSGVEVQTGEVKTITGLDTMSEVRNLTGFSNLTDGNITSVSNTTYFENTALNSATTYGHNETTLKTYAQVSLPYFSLNQTLSLLLFGMFIFGSIHYATTLSKSNLH